MAKTKIADFTAQLDIVVKNIKNLNLVDKTFGNLPKKLNKINTATKTFRTSVAAGNKELVEQARIQKKAAAATMAAIRKESSLRNRVASQSKGYLKQAQASSRANGMTSKRMRSIAGGLVSDNPQLKSMGDFYRQMENEAKGARRQLQEQNRKRRERAALRGGSSGPSGFAGWSKGVAGLEYQAKQKQAQALERIQQKFNRNERRREADKNREATTANRSRIQGENRRHQITMQNLRREMAEMRKKALESRLANLGGRGGRSGAGGSDRGAGRPRSAFMGGALGGMSGGFTGLVGGIAAGYGLGILNRANQEHMSASLTTQAVMSANGRPSEDGIPAFQWLKDQADRLGFSYMDSAQDYNGFLANSMGAGNSLEQAQDVFKGFSEYGRAMHLTPYRNKLVMNALSQMQGKGVVSMEELRRQMAESMPGTMGIFAEAYQEMTGGKDTGQKAIAKLIEDVGNGRVNSSEILPLVAKIMAAKAAPSLDKASKTSQSEQGRLSNAAIDSVKLFSEAGFEAGMARTFQSLAEFLKVNTRLVEALGRGFDKLSMVFRAFLNVASMIIHGLEGLAKWAGVSEEALYGLIVVSLALLTPWGKLLVVLAAIVLIIEDFYVYSQGGISVIGTMLDGIENSDNTALKDFVENFKEMLKAASELGTAISELFSSTEGVEQTFLGLAFTFLIEKINTSIERITFLMSLMAKLLSGEWAAAGKMVLEAAMNNVPSVIPGHELLEQMGKGTAEHQVKVIRGRGRRENGGNTVESMPVNIQIDGSQSPEAVGAAVKAELTNLMNITISNIPESYA